MVHEMNDRDSWEDERALEKFLGTQLLEGNLVVVIGAGVSFEAGLPGWTTLIERMYEDAAATRPTGMNNLDAADDLLNRVCSRDTVRYAECVRNALYKDWQLDVNEIVRSPLLCSLGALVMSSLRGSVAGVISFNFDHVLESYLRICGHVVESVVEVPAWAPKADVFVYHPHGMLPYDKTITVPGKVVLSDTQMDIAIAKNEKWRAELLSVLTSSVCVFVGLSGNDKNLMNLLTIANETHAMRKEGLPLWGVRFSDKNDDPKRVAWESRGVIQISVAHYRDIPSRLLRICQKAAELYCA